MVRCRHLVALYAASLFLLSSLGFAQAAKLAVVSVNNGLPITAGTPFSVVVVSQTAGGALDTVTAATGVSLTVTTGTSTLAGTTTGTIPAGKDSIVFSGLSYTKAENIVLTATRTSGNPLTSGSSGSIVVNPGAAAKIIVETAVDGSGTVFPAQSLQSGTSTATMYAISRDQFNNFIGNVAADSWSLVTPTGGVVASDLTTSSGRRNATFTGHL
ncbi:MAG TPA: hypothetical protein VF889_03550, partial [Bacteroidota bacterium]